MKQEYFVVVLAHSLRGRLRRVHIPHQAVYAILALALLGCFSVFGFVASYARMAWKVANYNALKQEADGLRVRYQSLQKVVGQTNEQLASLQLYAKEVSVAYGIKQKLEGPADISAEGKLVPTFAESVQDYDFLRTTNLLALPTRNSGRLRPPGAQPSMWPVQGLITGPFGKRSDPFSDEGAFHKGVDISVPSGTAVPTAARPVISPGIATPALSTAPSTPPNRRTVALTSSAATASSVRSPPTVTGRPDGPSSSSAVWPSASASMSASPRLAPIAAR